MRNLLLVILLVLLFVAIVAAAYPVQAWSFCTGGEISSEGVCTYKHFLGIVLSNVTLSPLPTGGFEPIGSPPGDVTP